MAEAKTKQDEDVAVDPEAVEVKKNPPKKAKAAMAEKKAEPKTGEYRGIKLTLPTVLPVTFAFDMAAIEGSRGLDFGAMHKLMLSALGEEQLAKVRDKLAADQVPFDEFESVMVELLDVITTAYGLTTGESKASAQS